MCLCIKILVKAFVVVCVSSLFCITNVYAKDKVSACVGISTIKLKDYKGIFDNSLSNKFKSDCPTFSAPTVLLEYMHGICNDYKVGARLGVIGKKINFILDCKGSPSIENNNSYCEIIAVPMMFGGSYSKNISEKFILNGKSFLGCTPINFKSKNSFTNKDSKEKIAKELNKTTVCFMLDFSVGAEYLFTKRFGIGFDVGYRYTPEITLSKDIKLDFSGATFALGLSYKI